MKREGFVRTVRGVLKARVRRRYFRAGNNSFYVVDVTRAPVPEAHLFDTFDEAVRSDVKFI